jgi:hypothetical protein
MVPRDAHRDWDKELAKVDRLMAGGEAAVPASSGAHTPKPGTTQRLSDLFFTWVRLALALILALGMIQWPYLHGCGWSLMAYLAGIGALLVASVWSTISSWRSRSVTAHFLSIGLLLWGSALGLREVLPRVGYARQSATWFCGQPREKPVTPS